MSLHHYRRPASCGSNAAAKALSEISSARGGWRHENVSATTAKCAFHLLSMRRLVGIVRLPTNIQEQQQMKS